MLAVFQRVAQDSPVSSGRQSSGGCQARSNPTVWPPASQLSAGRSVDIGCQSGSGSRRAQIRPTLRPLFGPDALC